ncbi:MAG: DinB family protein [Ignavibacteriae bacterium]|nr:DinB family protein [Ignavibacteriota bacterium]
MSLQLSITNSVDYNVWVTEQLIIWLKKHSEELLQRECPSSFNSIARTLKHISDTQFYWSAMIRGTESHNFEYNATEVNVQQEMQNLASEAKLLATYVKGNLEAMSQTHLIESEWFTSNFAKYEYLQHLIIHTTYHRGQIVTMGHNLGITDAPMLDYNYWNVMRQQSN